MKKQRFSIKCSSENEFILPDFSYKDFVLISEAKYDDLMGFMPFCARETQLFYESLKYDSKTKDTED